MNEREQAAFTLLLNGFDRKTAGLVLGVSEATVSGWYRKYRWSDKIAEERLFRETSIYKTRQLIQFQLDVHTAIIARQKDTLNSSQDVPSLKGLLIERGDIDALTKMLSTIKGSELSWEKMVSTVNLLFKYIEEHDLKLAQKLQPLAADFLEQKRMSL